MWVVSDDTAQVSHALFRFGRRPFLLGACELPWSEGVRNKTGMAAGRGYEEMCLFFASGRGWGEEKAWCNAEERVIGRRAEVGKLKLQVQYRG